MKRAVVQLGVGPLQRALLERIASAGLQPIAVDRDPEPAGLIRSAIHVQAPIDDPEAILRALSSRISGIEIGAVLTSIDLGVRSVSVVASALGLPHATIDSIRAMDDKQAAKELLSRNGVAVPMGVLVRSSADLVVSDEAAEVVVKPVDSSGSRGVKRARGRHAIDGAIREALSFSDRVLVEECVEGDHLDVNGTVMSGEFHLVSIGSRFFTLPPACVPIYGGIAARDDVVLGVRVTELMQRAVDAFGYRHGPVKADLIDTPRGLVALELAARFHGDIVSVHTAEAAGRPPAALHWLSRLGLCALPEARPQAGGWFAIFPPDAGKISRIEGLDTIGGLPGHRSWIARKQIGSRVGSPSDNRAVIGFGLFSGDKSVDLWSDARRRRTAVRVDVT